MARISDVNNRIEGHMILSNVEMPTQGFTLGFDERMNMNPSKFKRLGIRKIKCELSDNTCYPFALDIMYYDRSNGGNDMNFFNIRLNLTSQTSYKIAAEIVSQLNATLESRNKTPRLSTADYSSNIYINWYNAGNSTGPDSFEFSMVNDYPRGHVSFYGGEDSVNQGNKKITKDNN
jgi:hypothetical protein